MNRVTLELHMRKMLASNDFAHFQVSICTHACKLLGYVFVLLNSEFDFFERAFWLHDYLGTHAQPIWDSSHPKMVDSSFFWLHVHQCRGSSQSFGHRTYQLSIDAQTLIAMNSVGLIYQGLPTDRKSVV